MTDDDSQFIGHEPCPSCGSRDNLARYTDGHGYCFGCEHYEPGDGSETEAMEVAEVSENYTDKVQNREHRDLRKRGIRRETCTKFGYQVGEYVGPWKGRSGDSVPVQVAKYVNDDGVTIAEKLRADGKEFKIVGEGRNLPLWGQHLWRSGGKMVVITEGEIDCMSVSQAQGNKWPVVSLPNGAPSAVKAITRSLEWLETFERVVFMFDMDEPGQAAAFECAKIISPGKAFIANLSAKDPNELLVQGKAKALVDACWDAKSYRPDGIVLGETLFDEVMEDPVAKKTVNYPWMALNTLTMGMRMGEIVVLGAGTGMGKSTICREWMHWLLKQGHKIGVLSLEENIRRAAQHLMALEMEVPLREWHKRGVEDAEKERAFKATVGSGNCVLYDHWGSTDPSNLLSRVRHMVRGEGCQFVFLDHISILVSGLSDGDERRLIDNTMTRLRSLVEELEFHLVVVTHLKRLDNKSTAHEEGGHVSLAHFRGSGGIAQVADIAIGLERNQQADDDRDVSSLRVLKNRWAGETGAAGAVRYNRNTGRMLELDGFEPAETAADEVGF